MPKSSALLQSWRDLEPEQKQRLKDRLAAELALRQAHGPRPWRATARPKQLPPDDPRHHEPDRNGFSCGCDRHDQSWHVWLLLAGRGTGKTFTGSNWLVEQAMGTPGSEWAVIAPTFRDVRKTCVEGTTGILQALRPGELTAYRRNEMQIVLAGGSVIYGYSADQPERLRGANLHGAWCDEVGSWRYPAAWYEGLIPALRVGQFPRVVVTTTPRVVPLIRDLATRNDGSVHITRGSTWENSDNLAPAALEELRRRYGGTRLGRQELEGELLEDVDGALWARADIDETRITLNQVPDLHRVVVAIDPAVTSGEEADETGLVVVGEGPDGHGYVLADLTMRGTPDACMRAAVRAYHTYEADSIVAEVNNGGDYIRSLLRAVDPLVPYKSVRASRGKRVRAEPVSSLYEQRRMHHVGCFPQLEDQMCAWVPDSPFSPDRVDALVWAVTELRGLSQGSWLGAYGVTACGVCREPYIVEGHDVCPFCGTPAGVVPEAAA